jgi:pimeloyl-ACP methyl ester carboxylesterase
MALIAEPDGVTIALDHHTALAGDLAIPSQAVGIVLFAHGSGSSRFSPRNRFVAGELNRAGIGTLLLDLLTEEEEDLDLQTGALRFNLPLLAQRLARATAWLMKQPRAHGMRLGYFGASTGAAAALMAAAEHPERISAVVSRGGRPDLAGEALARVKAPTLLIVGGHDPQVIELNEHAFAQLKAVKALEIVPNATHLFEEPGALEEVARLARGWFRRYLRAGPAARPAKSP